MKINKRYYLPSRKRRELTSRIQNALKAKIPQIPNKKAKIEVLEISDGTQIIVINNLSSFMIKDNAIFPTLLNLEVLSYLPKITVDMGAVPHICNGAHLMAPGITKRSNAFHEGDIIVIIEERHAKSLAIGRTLFNSSQIAQKQSGKVAINLHYVGDAYWTFLKNL